MIRIFLKNFFYSTESLAQNRSLTSLQICFRPELSFLKLKKPLAQSVANRLVSRSQYYKSYKNLRYYYIKMLRANFCEECPPELTLYKLFEFDNRAFKSAYKQHHSIKNLDNVLLWRASRINSLFGIKKKVQKKKKQYILKQTVVYIKPYKRLLFVWKWLAILARAFSVKKTSKHLALIPSFENFFTAPDSQHVVTSMKFRIYRLQAIRNV